MLVQDGVRGLGMPPVQRYTSTSPAVHGSRWRGHRVEERDVFWPLFVWSDKGTADWLERDARLWRSFRPDVEGWWEFATSNAVRRLRCRFVDDSDHSFSADPSRRGWDLYGVRLVAEDPWWHGSTVRVEWSKSTGEGFLPGPPFSISGALDMGTAVMRNPGDVHACAPVDGRAMGYCNLNIPPKVLQQAAFEITGRRQMPHFGRQVLFRSELVPLLREVHGMVLKGEQDFHKEELFYFLLSQLLEESAPAIPQAAAAAQVQAVCDYLDQNYSETITLQQLSELTGWSKYHLLRTFTRQKDITPYSYLETVRVAQAKRLLVEGVCPMDAALRTGFSDQSHFTRFFKSFIGFTPKQYQKLFKENIEQEKK